MPRSRATPSRPPTSPAGGCSATARTTTSRLLAVGGSGQPLDDDAVGLDGDGDGAMARPVLGVEGVVRLEVRDVLDGHLELVGDPGIGAALSDPRADLVQLWF